MLYLLLELGIFSVIAGISFASICLTKKENDWEDKDDGDND